MNDTTIHLTAWPAVNEPNGTHATPSREDLLTWLRKPTPAPDNKRDLPGFSLARFEGDERLKKNASEVSAVVIDDDASGLTVQAVAAAWSGSAGFVHSTFSSTAEAPRTRVVLFTSRPMTGAEYPRVWSHVRDLATARGMVCDETTKDASRFWIVPSVKPDVEYEHATLTGVDLDVDAILAATPAQNSATPDGTPKPTARTAPPNGPRTAEAAAMLGAAWPAPGRRHEAQLALAGAMLREGWPSDRALEFLCAVCHAAGDEDRPKRERTIEHTYSTEENVTGWSTLEKLIDPAVVNAARDLLSVEAAGHANFMSFLDSLPPAHLTTAPANDSTAAASAVAPGGPKSDASTGGLGFTYGAWECRPAPVEFLVDGLIPAGAVVMFFGRADSLKTWLLFSLGLAVARGEPWLGHETKAAKVGIVDYETGSSNLARRLYMLRAGATSSLGAVPFPKGEKPSSPEFWIRLAKDDCDLVIIDSLRRSNPGANENDNTEAIRPLELAAEFAEATGCAVVWIHHAKKASSDGWPEFRGAGAIEDQVDCTYAVRKVDVSPSCTRVEVRCEKPGDMKKPDPFAVEVVFDDEAETATVGLAEAARPELAAARPREATNEELKARIRLALANGPLPTKEKIREA